MYVNKVTVYIYQYGTYVYISVERGLMCGHSAYSVISVYVRED